MESRLPSQAKETLIMLGAMQCLIDNHIEQLKKLSGRVDNGWRDMRLIQSRLDKLLEDIYKTVPLDQAFTILKQCELSDIRVAVRAPQRQADDYWVTPREDIIKLANMAANVCCMVCDNKTGKGCALRKILKELPAEDIDPAYIGCFR